MTKPVLVVIVRFEFRSRLWQFELREDLGHAPSDGKRLEFPDALKLPPRERLDLKATATRTVATTFLNFLSNIEVTTRCQS